MVLLLAGKGSVDGLLILGNVGGGRVLASVRLVYNHTIFIVVIVVMVVMVVVVMVVIADSIRIDKAESFSIGIGHIFIT